MQPLRQGDVLLIPIPERRGQPLPHLTLAKGEVTGHQHRICKGEATLYEHQGRLYLQVDSAFATLTHEEHAPIQVPQGIWAVRRQREYEPMGWRYVAD